MKMDRYPITWMSDYVENTNTRVFEWETLVFMPPILGIESMVHI